MIPLIWIGAALFAGAVVVGVFWNEIKDSEKDIPADILAKINRSSGREVDITDEVAEELHLENI